MRFLTLIVFVLAFSVNINAQNSTEYISTEIKKVEHFLQKQNAKLTLTNDQKSQLTKIFEDKLVRQNQIHNRKLDKIDMSNEITQLENEYKDKIESILNVEQRVAYQKIKKSQPLAKPSMN